MEYHQQKQWTEPQRKRKNGGTELPENKRKNGYRKSSYINNYPKFKWTEFTNKEAHCSKLDPNTKPNHMPPSVDICKLQKQS